MTEHASRPARGRRASARVLVAALIGSAALAGCAPADSTIETPAASGRASATVSGSPGVAQAAEPTAETAWWRMRIDPAMGQPVMSVEIGTLGGGVTVTLEAAQPAPEVELSAFPMRVAVGPSDGWVAVVGVDGPEMVVTAAHAASGEAHEVVRSTDVVVDAAFAAGSALIFVTADPRTGRLTGLWRVDVATDDDEPELIRGVAQPVGVGDPGIRLAARAVPHSRLYVSPDGSTAAVIFCDAGCVVHAVELDTGETFSVALRPADELIGLAGRLLVLRPVCEREPCASELADFETGERRPVPGDGWLTFRESVVAGAGAPILVVQESGSFAPMNEPAEDPSFSVIDLETLVAGPPIPVALGSMSVVAFPGYDMGVELPAGWFAALGNPPIPADGNPNVPMTAYAIDAATGRAVELPALGEFFIQG